MSSPPSSNLPLQSATLWRRFMSMAYEAVLLFGVVFVAAYLFDTLTQSKHALKLRHARQAWLFLVLGVYFVWFWAHGGQTLAMKTWRIRLEEDSARKPVSWGKAVLRYVLSWPLTLTGISYLWAFFDRDQKFLTDRLLRTRLVEWRPEREAARPTAPAQT